MHHLAVKSNLVDSDKEKTKLGYEATHQPLCPKPHRLVTTATDFLKPFGCSKHGNQLNSDGLSGVLDIISQKSEDRRDFTCCNGCLPSCYPASPPRRTGNPLLHDRQFIRQMEPLSPLART